MKSFLAFAALMLASSLPAFADSDARSVFVGSWQGTGTFYKTDMSKAGTSNDKTTCEWREGTTFLVCSQSFDGPFGTGSDVAIYTHAAPDAYAFVGINPDGTTRSPKLTVRPDGSMVYEASFEQNGKQVVNQTVNEFPSPGVEKWYVQYSLDGGKTWVRMADGISRRIPGK